MAKIDYYKRVDKNYKPIEIVEIYKKGGGLIHNLKILQSRELNSGEILDELYMITKSQYNSLRNQFNESLNMYMVEKESSNIFAHQYKPQ